MEFRVFDRGKQKSIFRENPYFLHWNTSTAGALVDLRRGCHRTTKTRFGESTSWFDLKPTGQSVLAVQFGSRPLNRHFESISWSPNGFSFTKTQRDASKFTETVFELRARACKTWVYLLISQSNQGVCKLNQTFRTLIECVGSALTLP